MVAGIYLITNKINGHMYVGGSINIKKRLNEHKRGSDLENQAIDRAILKYGKENFTYQIITELPADWKVIGKHEKYWINFYNTFEDKNHYNLTEGGGGTSGWKHSEDFKKEQSKRMSGENNPFYNKTHTKESRDLMSKNLKGNGKGIPKTKKSNIKRSNSISKKINKYGFYRLTKKTNKSNPKENRWLYQVTDNGKRKEISSRDFFTLVRKVKEQGFLWTVVDVEKAVETVRGLYD